MVSFTTDEIETFWDKLTAIIVPRKSNDEVKRQLDMLAAQVPDRTDDEKKEYAFAGLPQALGFSDAVLKAVKGKTLYK
ncbi:hypothetical protein FACS189479_04700 [Spirochaetia bacterium]|nr:hypothetical protein FACS189479_04700 [Spirochaetia bacterium]